MATVEIAASVPVALPPPEPIDPQYRPSTSVAKLPASAPVEEILKIIDRDGGIILEDFASEEELASIKTELDANEPVDFDTRRGASGITPQQTNLTPGLVGRSTTAASLCEKPVLDKVRAHILTDRWPMTRGSYHIERQIDPLLSLSIGFDIGPGAHRQYLHRDDAVHNIRHDRPFDLQKVSQIGCLVAGVDTYRENGATMFIPGSHRWDDNRKPRLDEICFAEMKKGSILIFLGCAYHGGGQNATQNSRRVVYGYFYCRGTLRQEENQFLVVPHKKVLQMTPKMQALLGYKKPENNVLGVVAIGDPMKDLPGVLAKVNA